MKSQVLHTVWCKISGEDAGEIGNWALVYASLKNRCISPFFFTSLQFSPYVFSNGTKFEGFYIDVLNRLSEELKFTYEIRRVADGKFGAISDGVWNGLIGDLVRKVGFRVI